ncbi:MAG: hypothetical protein FRX48_09334 [Lasallia pustulata]|uniref:Uncharacterized protein n=1 Tax=Lasallia pustulata TaxID=136370 RepID=A0A5M8PCX1_9LECA|nr:MAG: hypothetical protein FRX48_09334 [Lasallia pustulata]
MVSVKELAERILNQPGTAQIAADLGALVQRMDSVEQNTTITKNLLEKPVDRSSNPSATIGYQNTRLWAQVAAQAMPPPSEASFPSTFAAQSTKGIHIDLSTPDDRRVVIKLDSIHIDHYRTLTPRALRNQVANHIHTSTDPKIATIRVAAAKQLRSRDLAIYTQTVTEKEALQANPGWAKAFGASKKQTIACIQAENHKIGNEKDIPISYVGWLCVPKRAAGSMVVEFKDAEQVNVALQTGLVWDLEYKKTELYDRACQILESEDCPSKDLGKRKCAPSLAVPSTTQTAPILSSALQAGIYTPININNSIRIGVNATLSKASVVRGLQKMPALPTPKSGSALNINGKRLASPTKTGSNRTPLGTISNNGRTKRTVIKSLKQQSIDADAEAESASASENRGPENSTNDTIASTSL